MIADDHIRIEAPDVTTAFGLEKRLIHLQPTTVCRHGAWTVEFHSYADRLDEVEPVVGHWLGEYGLRSTRVHVDGGARRTARHVSRPRRRSSSITTAACSCTSREFVARPVALMLSQP